MDISQLSDALRNEVAYPEQMKCVDSGIHGQGFYPGCQGFSSQKSPHGGLMLLGRDFGVESYYDGLVGSPVRDETALTWRHTREIYFAQPPHPTLSDLPVWCTNYLMGVRLEGSAKGNVRERISMPEWVKYEDTCWGFLQRQVLLQKPLVIALSTADPLATIPSLLETMLEKTKLKNTITLNFCRLLCFTNTDKKKKYYY